MLFSCGVDIHTVDAKKRDYNRRRSRKVMYTHYTKVDPGTQKQIHT